MPSPTAADIIAKLELKPHPEGGHYRETFRDPRVIDGRLVDGPKEEIVRLGGNIHDGGIPQAIISARVWQAAESLGDWTLVGRTVAPGFSFDGFELAPKNWSPGR